MATSEASSIKPPKHVTISDGLWRAICLINAASMAAGSLESEEGDPIQTVLEEAEKCVVEARMLIDENRRAA